MRYRLLQARIPGDVVKNEERVAFASRLGISIDQIDQHDLLNDPLDYATVVSGTDCLLVGGSGAFGLRDRDEHVWIQHFVDLLAEVADHRFPMFASCFGFQGLVVALGGDVAPDEASAEVGSFELSVLPDGKTDPLFRDVPDTFWAQLGHKDRAMIFPEGVQNLARSERCPYQALRVPGAPIYATQFHPELTHTDNKGRFKRYYDMYAKVFGDGEADRMMEHGFKPSEASNALLPRFAALLAAGELG